MSKKEKGKRDWESHSFGFGDKAHTSGGQRLCHMGPKLVFEVNGLEVYGGSKTEAANFYHKFDLVISAGEHLRMEEAKSLTSSILKSINLVKLVRDYCPENLYLDWRDFGVPTYPREFWKGLVEILRKKGRDRKRRGGAYKVLVHCMGGHGRTGTVVAILAGLGSKWIEEDEGVDLVEKVRGIYCHHAIETYGQVRYVEEITGRGSRAEVKARGVNTSTYLLPIERASSTSRHLFTDPCPSPKEVESSLRNMEKVEKRGREVNVIHQGVARLEGESVEDWKKRARETRETREGRCKHDVKLGYCLACGVKGFND